MIRLVGARTLPYEDVWWSWRWLWWLAFPVPAHPPTQTSERVRHLEADAATHRASGRGRHIRPRCQSGYPDHRPCESTPGPPVRSAPVRRSYAPAATGRTEEPSPGHYDFSEVDQLFSLAKSDGLTVLFELGEEPSWDTVGGNSNAPPSDCDAPSASCTSVRQYVTAFVDHAAPEGLRYLIVRNEPQDFNKNWVGGDAASYAHFQSVVYQAAHAADPAH